MTGTKRLRSEHRARPGGRLASASVVLLALLALAGCETGALGGFGSLSGESRAIRLSQNGEYAEAAAVYIGLASETVGGERDRLTLLAVEQWLNAADITRARSAFTTVSEPQSGENLWLWHANSAAFALFDGNADRALELLEPLSREPLPMDHRSRIDALRADAWFQKGDPARAVEIMIQRESRMSRGREIEQNRRRLWQGLSVSSPENLRTSAESVSDPVVRGWLSLGALAAATGQQGIGWANGARRWREAHRDHPAIVIIDDLDLPESLRDYPRQVALLLPLSGNAESAGQAIQNGFFGAYFSTARELDESQTIRVYDVNAEGGASAAYASAVRDGAEFVVGPLLRSSVTELANDILVPVPVLTLNHLPENTLTPPGLYQFALAPEHEAAAAAERAIADGHRYVVALIPNSDWGRRVFSSFATTFEALGGTLLDYRSYVSGNPDFSNTIEDLMALSGSVRRYQRLRANIGGPLQFDPRRRQDVDAIFMAADAAAGRLMKAQLKFHYAGDLPVYSTSSIFGMDGRSNADLNGVMFADTPWIISPQPWISRLPALYEEYWPRQRRLGRLHAMGYDAYQLVAPLFASRGGPVALIDGATGRLRVDADGKVHRDLAWAQFQRGEPVALPRYDIPDDVHRRPYLDGESGDAIPPDATDAEEWYEEIVDD